ncbi:serine O-acetyltransferase [Enterococcus gilvus]|uniref:serine O-acetyltransferase n=1 Tax=Enterococcus gilvus TaxID=160453 RepID=UPI001C8CC382|nr:serine acetyltransferase [Enterococcus gilvus]MBX8936314.1 serine acetyltransferase [Enterococcus gilvus]
MVRKEILKKIAFTLLLPILSPKRTIWLYAVTQNTLNHYFCIHHLRKYGISITNGAVISPEAVFPHPQNIVIGGGVQIDEGAVIYQGVTLGLRNGRESIPENKNFDYYPKIRSHAVIYANAVIVGNIEIGKQSVVGANSFVNRDVPPDAVVAGNPAKRLK